MKAYKAMSRDLKCRDVQFEEGGTYEVEGPSDLCRHGFHFCKDLVLTLAYYPIDYDITENSYAEVEILGDLNWEMPNKHKGVTNKIKILRIIPDEEVKALVDANNNSGKKNTGARNSGDLNSGYYNSGDLNTGYDNSGYKNTGDDNSGELNSGSYNAGRSNAGSYNTGNRNTGNYNDGKNNSGHRNSGDSNTGSYNSGDYNTGNHNLGDYNTGDHNSCDRETGFFNSRASETINVFNKPCLRAEWADARKPSFISFTPDPEIGYKKGIQKSFENYKGAGREREIELLKALPNFDADVFFEITGIVI